MEYRSRLKRRKRSNAGGGGRAVIALIMIAGLVYLAASSKAGDWVAANVMAPIFAAFNREPGETAESDASADSSSGEEAVAVSLSSGLRTETVTAALPRVDCFMLQTGVYSVEANALSQAETLRAAGAGGYVLEDGGRYRVLAAGYSDEGSASAVKARLISEGMDTTVYTVSTPSASFRITVSSDRAEAVEKAFSALHTAHGALTELAMSFDAASADASAAALELNGLLAALQSDTVILDEYSSKSDEFARIAACRDSFLSAMRDTAAKAGQSIVDFSAELKYTQLYLTYEYVGLMSSFA